MKNTKTKIKFKKVPNINVKLNIISNSNEAS